MLKLNDRVTLYANGKKIRGRIVGIDSYSLENFEGKKQRWLSYTLVSDKKGILSRFWVTDWKKDGWVLWTTGKKKKNVGMKMVTGRSGISRIEFAGNQGISTPFSSVAVFSSRKGRYYAFERFADSDILYLDGQKIAGPVKY